MNSSRLGNLVVIIQARMSSTRLPGKVLRQVLGKPLLSFQIERIRRLSHPHVLILATSTDPSDNIIESYAQEVGVRCHRGSLDDVLARYHSAAVAAKAQTVVRLTADCPVIDPKVIDHVIGHYDRSPTQPDYVSNSLRRTYPRGMDCEIFSFQSLDEAFREANEAAEREHVTPFIYRNSERYRLENVAYPSDHHEHRWTVDTPEDFELIRRLIENLYPSKPTFDLEDLLALSDRFPEWRKLNSHIEQKKL
jgi:spore coat polysaccharide biosynthesis protein SpsF